MKIPGQLLAIGASVGVAIATLVVPTAYSQAPAGPPAAGPRGGGGFGPPPQLGPDDKPFYAPAQASAYVPRDGVPKGKMEVVTYHSKHVGTDRRRSEEHTSELQ